MSQFSYIIPDRNRCSVKHRSKEECEDYTNDQRRMKIYLQRIDESPVVAVAACCNKL
jgi:hypothetical protein